MQNIMEYKGYFGNLEFSEDDKIFFGKVLGIKSLVSYEGVPVRERLWWLWINFLYCVKINS